MKKTIFISSTYEDLKQHREEVWKTLEKHEVNVKGMENFGARKTGALETCLTEVRDSDIYIGIIGMVYGSIEKQTKKSFTQLEYEEAVKNNLDIYVYLVNESEVLLNLKHVDFKNHRKLKGFKKQLKDKHTVAFFKDSEELRDHINGLLNQLTDSLIISRPRILEAKLFRFDINNIEHGLFIAYYKSIAYEIWVGIMEQFYLPLYVNDCFIHETRKEGERIRYDIEFEDKQGYRIIVPALNRLFEKDTYNIARSVSVMLTERVPLRSILDYLSSQYYSLSDTEIALTNQLAEKLRKNYKL